MIPLDADVESVATVLALCPLVMETLVEPVRLVPGVVTVSVKPVSLVPAVEMVVEEPVEVLAVDVTPVVPAILHRKQNIYVIERNKILTCCYFCAGFDVQYNTFR